MTSPLLPRENPCHVLSTVSAEAEENGEVTVPRLLREGGREEGGMGGEKKRRKEGGREGEDGGEERESTRQKPQFPSKQWIGAGAC